MGYKLVKMRKPSIPDVGPVEVQKVQPYTTVNTMYLKSPENHSFK